MNWDQIAGQWKQAASRIREKWGKLTDDDLQSVAGRRDQLIGRLQERYGIAREEAEREVDAFSESYQLDEPPSERARRAGKA